MYLIIENLPAHTQVTDLSAFLSEKGFTEYQSITLVGKDGLVAIVHCRLTHTALNAIAHYLDQLYWRGRILSVTCNHIFE